MGKKFNIKFKFKFFYFNAGSHKWLVSRETFIGSVNYKDQLEI